MLLNLKSNQNNLTSKNIDGIFVLQSLKDSSYSYKNVIGMLIKIFGI